MQINERLKNSGLLRPAFMCIAKSNFHAMKNSDERTEKFLRMTINAIEPSVRLTDSEWIAFKEVLGSVDENELNSSIEEFVDYLLENPNDYVFFVLSLSKLDF
jgi:hypothetical protein